ncbi:DedA family protein [Halorientalis halophila]|uniref:DedA family protein n=1 Tax=Halorientalis halophila TaxID=3108499 RepID=UPI003008D2E5
MFAGVVQSLTDTAVTLVERYGLVALFLFILLETAWITHFVPSEIVIPAVAYELVTDPASFAIFTAVLTVGAVLGSLIAYYLFGYYGDVALERYGDSRYLPTAQIERSKRFFRRYGENSLLWGRLVPVFRTPISIPAGYAGTPLPKFVVYSTVGWTCYNAVLIWLVYSGGDGRAPVTVAYGAVEPHLVGSIAWLSANPAVAAVATLAAAGSAVAVWLRTDRTDASLT